MAPKSWTDERIDEFTLRVTRKSAFTGEVRTRDFMITAAQWDSWTHGVPIQCAMPGLSSDDREFLMTGTTKEEWNAVFGEKEDGG